MSAFHHKPQIRNTMPRRLLLACLLLAGLCWRCSPLPCDQQSDCPPQLYCDLERQICVDVVGVCQPGADRPCYEGPIQTKGVGACQSGSQSCLASGQWGPCQGQIKPAGELCNGKDDNCDGQIDEGCSNCAQECPKGQTCCGGQCVNLFDNRLHCGACYSSCPSSHHDCCLGQCYDLTSPRSCGACGNICKDGAVCCDGNCTTLDDTRHCGGCGVTCKADELCRKGRCQSCQPPTQKCTIDGADTCVDVTTNAAHCGACGNQCPSHKSCIQGRCVSCISSQQCPAGTVCREGGQCVAFKDDENPHHPFPHATFAVGQNGSIYAAGTFYEKETFITKDGKVVLQNHSTNADIYLLKYDPKSQNISWVRHLGGKGIDSKPQIALDDAGHVYISGIFGKGDPGASFGAQDDPNRVVLRTPAGYNNGIFVASFQSDGRVRWVSQLHGGDYANLPQLAVLAQNGESAIAFVTGGLASNKQISCNGKDILPSNAAPTADTQLIVARLDAKGQCKWATVIGQQDAQPQPTGLAFLYGLGSVRDLTLTGSFRNELTWGTTTLKAKGEFDAFALHITDEGKPGNRPAWQAGARPEASTNHLYQLKASWTPQDGQRSHTIITGTYKGSLTLPGKQLLTPKARGLFVAGLQHMEATKATAVDASTWIEGQSIASFRPIQGRRGRIFVAAVFIGSIAFPNGVQLTSKGERDIVVFEWLEEQEEIGWVLHVQGARTEDRARIYTDPAQPGVLYLSARTNSPTLWLDRRQIAIQPDNIVTAQIDFVLTIKP